MDNYLAALVDIQKHDDLPVIPTMKIYLETIRYLKKDLLNNLSVSHVSIQINNEGHSQTRPLKDCLVKLAVNSLTILSKLKKTTTKSIISSNTKLFEDKNADYGNSFVDFELIGIIVRLNDKINRILNLGESASSEAMKINEKIEDTINDLYNYCVIGLMYTR